MLLVGKDIYERLIKGYAEKQWGRKCTELPAFIIKRLPVRLVFDNNYFNDKYLGIPVGGYSKLIDGNYQGNAVVNYTEREFKEKVEPLVGYEVNFCQDNESTSSYGVMRGLHFQRPPFTQSKLERCVKGSVLDESLGIDWKIPTEHANLSEKDTKHQLLKDFESPF